MTRSATHRSLRALAGFLGLPGFLLTLSVMACRHLLPPTGSAAGAAEARNVAVGRPYTLVPEPNYAHCTDDGDATQLTDGELVSDRQFWIQPGCVGWKLPVDGDAEAVIDLGSVHAIDSIRFRTSSGPNADVYLPSATFAVSDDSISFHVVGRVDTREDGQLSRRWVAAEALNTRGRYVMVRLHAHGVFAFWDEIEVYEGAHNPAAVELPEETIERLEVEPSQTPLQRRLLRDVANMRNRLADVPDDRAQALLARLAAAEEEINALSETVGDAAEAAEDKVVAAHHDLVAVLGAEAIVRAWPAHPYAELSPLDLPPRDRPAEIRVEMGRNAHAAAAVNLTNLSDENVELSIALEGLDGLVQVREARFIPTRQGNLLADALPLLDRGVLSVPPRETQQVWISLASGGQAPGTYSGALVCSPCQPGRVNITVEIVPVRIPDDLPLSCYSWQYVDIWPALKGIEQQAVADLVAHHTNVCMLTSQSVPWPQDVDDEGNLTGPLDFTQHDRMIELCRPMGSHGIGWFLALEYGKPGFDRFQRLDHRWRRLLAQWLRAWVAHLQELGIGYDDFLFYPLDETIDEVYVEMARLVREVDPQVRLFADPLARDSDERLRQALPLVDVWCPNLRAYAKRPWQLKMIGDTGATVWSYMVGRREASPYKDYRLHLWKAWEVGATGAGFWCYAQGGSWQDDDLWDDFSDDYSDFGVIYALQGAPEDVSRAEAIIPGKRWEAWREGIEDYVYLHLLNKALDNAPDAAADRAWLAGRVADVLASPADVAGADRTRAQVLRRLETLTGASRR